MIEKFINHYKSEWPSCWKDSKFRINLGACLLVTSIFPCKSDMYMAWVQRRDGYILDDIFLDLIPPMDVSNFIFSILYTFSILTLCRLSVKPKLMLWLVWSFNIETALRFLCIYLVPLNPPPNLIEMPDRVAEFLVYGANNVVTKDLFFSGHTSTMVLASFFLPSPTERMFSIIFTFILGILLLVQHIHYTIDILAAPIFTLLSIYVAKYISMS